MLVQIPLWFGSTAMKFFSKWKQPKKIIGDEDIARTFRAHARKSLMRQDLRKAIAYLERGICMAPDHLPLYLERAQIYQYGLSNYTEALKDYRHIMRKLSESPDHPLIQCCKNGMHDMMNESGETCIQDVPAAANQG